MSEVFNLSSLTGSYSLNGNGSLIVGGTIAESSGTFTFSDGVELPGFKSGNLSIEGSSVDNATRSDGGWGVSMPGMRSATLDVTYNKQDGTYSTPSGSAQSNDVHFRLAELMTASQADWSTKGVAIKYTSKAKNNSGKWVTKGFFGVFVPTSYSESQSGGGDNDGTAVEVSVSFASYGALHSFVEVEQ